MKTIILSVALIALSMGSFAQSEKFQKVMQQNIGLLDSAKTPEQYVSLAATFERIGDAEKSQWLPYYYAALANISRGFTDEKANKDEVADKADGLIAKAEAIDSKNSEIALLKSMAATLHMIVDPMSRWQKYGMMQREALENAKQFDENNPRVYYWEAQNTMHTPAQFGGGKDKAKPIFEKSLGLYKTFKPVNSLYPTWGQATAEKMLAECNEKGD